MAKLLRGETFAVFVDFLPAMKIFQCMCLCSTMHNTLSYA